MNRLPSSRLCFLIVACLALAAWGRAVTFGFVWDDHYFILDNQAIRSVKSIPAMFDSRIAEADNPSEFPNFRPLRNVAYSLLYLLGGRPQPQPWIFHLANVLGHAVAAMLLFAVASLLFRPLGQDVGRWAAFWTAAAFALHPAVSEVVCWAKSLDDILAAVFVLAAARQLLLWQGRPPRYLAAVGFFVLAIYSKESAVPFAALVFFLFRAVHQFPWRRSAMLTFPFLAVAGIYMLHRSLVLGGSAQCAPISGSYGQTLLDTIPACAIYFRLLWGIPPFSVDYTDMHGHLRFLSPPVLAGLIVLLGWGAAAAWAWRKENFRLAAFGLLWLGFFLLPVANIVPMMQYLAERFLYLPLAGWLLALATVLAQVPNRRVASVVMALLLLFWLPVSLAREAVWRDEVTLFVHSSLARPQNKRLRENAVVAIFSLPQMASTFGLDETTRRLRVAASIPRARGDAILQTLTEARAIFPDEERFTAALGITRALLGQITNAIPLLELATRQGANDPECWIDLGTAYSLEKNWPKARASWQAALRLDPTNRLALEHLRALPK